MDVKLPDGTVVKNVPDGISKADLVTKLKSNGMSVPDSWSQTAPAAPPQSAFDKLIGTAKGLGENALAMGSSAIALPAGGIAGLGQMANNALGIGPQQDPSKAVADTQDALTYSPKTQQGQAIQQGIGKVTAPVGKFVGDQMDQFGQNMSDATGSPLVGAIAKGALGALPQAIGMKLPEAAAGRAASMADEAVNTTGKVKNFQAAREAGYALPPTEATNAPIGKNVLTGVAGKDQVNAAFTHANQKVTNSLAKTDIGISKDLPLNDDTITAATNDANRAYEAIKSAPGPIKADDQYFKDIGEIGKQVENKSTGDTLSGEAAALKKQYSNINTYTAEDTINAMKRLRAEARTNFKAYDNVGKQDLAQAQLGISNALEDMLGRHLDDKGLSSLYSDFTDARTKLAKINTINEAMEGGDVNAAKVKSIRDKMSNPDVMSGGLGQIADAAQNFPKVVRSTKGVDKPGALSALDYVMKTAALAGGGMAAGGAHGASGGAVAAAALAARPTARGFIGSNFYQNQLKNAAPTPGILNRLATQPASPLAGLLVSPEDPVSQ